MLSNLCQDIRYAARAFSRRPGFAAATVLTLALGIGASTAIFSVVYGVLLKPLPFREPSRLVSINHRSQPLKLDGMNHGPATYFTMLDNQRVMEAVGAWEANEVSLTGHGDPERVEALAVSHTTLPLLGVQPALGRLFIEADDQPRSPLRAVLSYGYWQRAFGGARNVVGQRLDVDGERAEIIGVLSRGFTFLRTDADLLLPMRLDRADADHIEFDFQALGRLKPGVTVASADADMARWIALLPPMFAKLELQPKVLPLSADVIGDVGRVLWVLLGAVGIVLLIACGNVANLLLVRAEGRQQEFATRSALGASRGRLARALLSESVLLAMGGGAAGLIITRAAVGLLRRIAPAELPRIGEIGIHPPVLLFTLAVSVASGLLFGLVAVLRFGAPSAAALKEGGRSGDTPGRHRTRNALVVSQVALALSLMILSGLMIRTFGAMLDVRPGFTQPEQVQTFGVAVPEALVADDAQFARLHEQITQRLAGVPGVVSVGLSSSVTMDGEDNGNTFHAQEFPVPEKALPPLVRYKSFAPGYFETMGNHMVAGRSITWSDVHERRNVIVLSEVLARQYWKEPERAIGKLVSADPSLPWREIVGVVGEERDDGLNRPATPILYWPLVNDNYNRRALIYVVRSGRAGTAAFVRELQQVVWSVNPNLPLATVRTLDDIRARSMAQTSFAMVMLAIAGAVALLLGIVGIYGVIAYVAAQRTREIGIRIALGAQVGDVRRIFLRHGLALTATGIALGIGVALLLTRAMAALLFGVAPVDPVTYVAGALALASVALLAIYVPARRASRVDPIVAMRAEA